MHKIREILEEGHTVMVTANENIPMENGIIDDIVLADRKKKLMSFGMHYLRDDFVKEEKSFPEDNEIEVKLHLDFVVLQGDDYRRLMKLIDRYE
jgi:hypothetical protein